MQQRLHRKIFGLAESEKLQHVCNKFDAAKAQGYGMYERTKCGRVQDNFFAV